MNTIIINDIKLYFDLIVSKDGYLSPTDIEDILKSVLFRHKLDFDIGKFINANSFDKGIHITKAQFVNKFTDYFRNCNSGECSSENEENYNKKAMLQKLDRLIRTFKGMDKKNLGYITYDDFSDVFTKLREKGKEISEDEIRKQFDFYDLNKSGRISWYEYLIASMTI